MVLSEVSAGGGHCGGATWTTSSSVCEALLPFNDVRIKNQSWASSQAQQQLLWATLQSLKERAAQAFIPVDAKQQMDPFRETYSDGGLFGAGCNYAVGFHGIQGRQPKSEDYVLHLALGPNLFAPFDDCSRACLACVLDGHGGTGAVRYVAERFPAYLLEDLPRLRSQPAVAMRSALHRIDEELTALGHNSGTTVNALLLVDNHVTVVNTGDCRCILYDWVDERAVQVTNDHNLQCTRERERVLGEGAELSGCGGYVVLPCPTDGAKLLGVTKALGHAGVKALQRSCTLSSLSGILETPLTSLSPRLEQSMCQPQLLHVHVCHQQQQLQLELTVVTEGIVGPAVHEAGAATGASSASSSFCGGVGGAGVGGGFGAAWGQLAGRVVGRMSCDDGVAMATGPADGGGGGAAVSGSGMSDDEPVMPATAAMAATGEATCPQADVEMCAASAPAALPCHPCPQLLVPENCGPVASLRGVAAGAGGGAASALVAATASSSSSTAPDNNTSGGAAVAFHAPLPLPQRSRSVNATCLQIHQQQQPLINRSSFATVAAAAAVTAAVAATHEAAAAARAVDSLSSVRAELGQVSSTPSATGTLGSFVLTCEPDQFEFTVEDDRHMVLIGCDGVFDKMKNVEACKTAVRQLTASNSCVDAAREVAHRACRLGSCDNITALVIRFGRKPIVRRQSLSVLSFRRSSSNIYGDLAAAAAAAEGPK